MKDIYVRFKDYSNVYIECEDSIFFEMRDYFSFEADGYRFNPKFRYGQWDGRIRLLDNQRNLPIGLTSFVEKFASNMNYSYHIDPIILEKENISREDFNKWIDSKKIYDGDNIITPYDYQKESVYVALNERRKILNLPTSAGKSLIQALISRYYAENYEGKILIIVPTTSLVDQMVNDFVNYRLFPREALLGIRGGTARDSDALIYVSTWQTAVKQSADWFSQFGMMMNDECHLSVGKSISDIVKKMTKCPFKYGLSGSLKDGKANIMQYVGLFGSVFKPVSTHDLMESGRVSKLAIKSIFIRYPDNITKAMKGKTYQEEIKIITNGKKRNKWVANLAIKLAKRDENVFLMFKHAEHGKMLMSMIKEQGYDKVHFINGTIDTNVRNELKTTVENNKGIIVVASYGVFSTGISIKNLHHIIFGHPIKSKITVLQTIGRILRKHDSKKLAILWDICDDMGVKPKSANAKKKYVHLNYALKHALDRIERYASERFDYTTKTIEL